MASTKIDTSASDGGLLSCMKLARVDDAWINSVKATHGIETLDDFVSWQSSSDSETTLSSMLNAIESLKGKRLILARFKTALELGKPALEAIRAAPSKVDEDLDAPVPDSVREQLQLDWKKTYNLVLEPYTDPSDALKGRVWREFRKGTATVLLAKQMKSLLCVSTTGRHESISLPGNVRLTFDQEQNISIRSVVDYYYALRTLAIAWAWSGNFLVTCASDNQSRRMMELSTAIAYADFCLRSAMEFGKGDTEWLTRLDLMTRGRMATLVRQNWSADAALTQAQKMHYMDWRTFQGISSESRDFGQEVEAPQSAGGSPQGQKRPRRETPDRRRSLPGSPAKPYVPKTESWQTFSQTKGGTRLCKPWNDARGCHNKKCKDLHACDVRKTDGTMCGSSKHNRQSHE